MECFQPSIGLIVYNKRHHGHTDHFRVNLIAISKVVSFYCSLNGGFFFLFFKKEKLLFKLEVKDLWHLYF